METQGIETNGGCNKIYGKRIGFVARLCLISFAIGALLCVGSFAITMSPGWQLAGKGDFNGDGSIDLAWRNTDSSDADKGKAQVWLMDGAVSITSQNMVTNAAGKVIAPGLDWNLVAAVDADGDGKPDLVWNNSTSKMAVIWFMNGYSVKSGVYLSMNGSVLSTGGLTFMAAGDVYGDGNTQILWRNTDNTIIVWNFSGTSVTSVSAATWQGGAVAVSSNWTLAKIIRLSSGDQPSLVWYNSVNGRTAFWKLTDSAITYATGLKDSSGNIVVMNSPSDWKIADMGDFNNDGYADILRYNNATGEISITDLTIANGVVQATSTSDVTFSDGAVSLGANSTIYWINGYLVIYKGDSGVVTSRKLTYVSATGDSIKGDGGSYTASIEQNVKNATLPTTTATFSGTPGNNRWYVTDGTVGFSVENAGGATLFCIDQSNQCSATNQAYYADDISGGKAYPDGSSSISTEGLNYVRYYSTSVNGNENLNSLIVKLDKTAPSGGSVSYSLSGASITISVSPGADTVSGLSSSAADYLLEVAKATLSNGACGSYSAFADAGVSESPSATSYTYAGASDSCYKFRYTVKDKASNSAVYTNDSEIRMGAGDSPVTTLSISGGSASNGWYTSQVNAKLTATASGASSIDYTKYCVDTTNGCSPTTTYTGGYITIPSGGVSGVYYLRYNSADTDGNVEATQSYKVQLDNGLPTASASPNGGAFSSSQTVTITCSDSLSGAGDIYYNLGYGWNSYTSPVTISQTLTMTYYCVDKAGNPSTTGSATFTASSPTINSFAFSGKTTSSITTTATVSQNGTGYCAAVTAGASSPSALQMQLGGGGSIVAVGSATMTASANTICTVNGLSSGTVYDLYFVTANNAGYTSSLSKLASVMTGPPTTSSVSYNSATTSAITITASINDSGSGYCAAIISANSAPTAAQVIAGSGGGITGTAGSVAMSANANASCTVTALNANTAYDIYFAAKDGYGNAQTSTSKVSNVSTIINVDTNSFTYSTASSSSITAVANINTSGTGYCVAVANGGTAPTPAQVVAGTGGAITGTQGSVAMTANTNANCVVTGLSPGTSYDLYFVAKDGYGNTESPVNSITNKPTIIGINSFTYISKTTSAITTRGNIDAAGTGYCVAVATGGTAPTAAQIVAGTGGAITGAGGSVAMTANTNADCTVTGLSSTTAYDLYFACKDTNDNVQSNTSTVSNIVTGPPATNSFAYSSKTYTTFTGTANISDSGTGYCAAVATNDTAPTSAQVIAGSGGAITGTGGSVAMTASTNADCTVTGLTENTAYDFYFAAKDSNNNAQADATVAATKVTSTTPMAPPTTTTAFAESSKTDHTWTGSATISKNGTGYCTALTTGSTAPTAAEVAADNNASKQGTGGSVAMTGAASANCTVTGLSDGTTYDFYFVAEESVLNTFQSNATASGSKVTTATSNLAPTTSTAFAEVSKTTSSWTGSATINEAGTGYCTALASGSTAPTAEEVAADNNANKKGTGGSVSMTSGVSANCAVTGLPTGTTYDFYFVAEDSSNNMQSNATASASKVSATLPCLAGSQTFTGTGSALAANNTYNFTTTASFGDNCTVTDINLQISITHNYIYEVKTTLKAPDGTSAVLIHNKDSCNAYPNITLDDEAGTAYPIYGTCNVNDVCVITGTPPTACSPNSEPNGGNLTTNGTYQTDSHATAQPLSTLDGKVIKGDWTLELDNQGGDPGTLNSWSIIVTYH